MRTCSLVLTASQSFCSVHVHVRVQAVVGSDIIPVGPSCVTLDLTSASRSSSRPEAADKLVSHSSTFVIA